MNYCEKIRQSMIDGDDDSVVKYIKKISFIGIWSKIHIKKYINRCAKFDCKERRKKWMFNTRSTTGYAGI